MAVFFKKKHPKSKKNRHKKSVKTELNLPRVNLKMRGGGAATLNSTSRRRTRAGKIMWRKVKASASVKREKGEKQANAEQVLVERVSRSLDLYMRNPTLKNLVNRRFIKDRKSFRPKLFNNLNIRKTLSQLNSSKNFYFFLDFNQMRNLKNRR